MDGLWLAIFVTKKKYTMKVKDKLIHDLKLGWECVWPWICDLKMCNSPVRYIPVNRSEPATGSVQITFQGVFSLRGQEGVLADKWRSIETLYTAPNEHHPFLSGMPHCVIASLNSAKRLEPLL
jgi:hypothetical protein